MNFDKPSVIVSKITLFDGQHFSFESNDKVVIVGPNNSGKSQFLRDILKILGSNNECFSVVIQEIELVKSGTLESFSEYIKKTAKLHRESYYLDDWSIHQSQLGHWGFQNRLGYSLVKGFVKRVAAKDRLNICQQQDSISPGDQKTKPQHLLYDDEELMNKVSALFYQAFNKQLMFDFRGGKKLPIHVGDIPSGIEDRVSNAYVDAVRNQPLLDEQGDGMKSYAGILFESIVTNKNITLIDEPEAFLHPPQMRRLGETLAAEVKGQLFMATHSSDILRGFLESTKGKVRILRIQREGALNVIHEASAEVLSELWMRPNLRYSNALDGIFYEQTIICEDDSDCRLIHAVADHLEVQSENAWKDTAYVPAGGKDAIPKIAKVLREIGVPVKAVFDLDLLADKNKLKETVEAFSGDWKNFERSWGIVDAGIRDKHKQKSKDEIFRDVQKIVNDSTAENFNIKSISQAIKNYSPWRQIKEIGSQALPSGGCTKEFNTLIDELAALGIYLVPVGEIENFSKETAGHGPKFVTNLLEEKNLEGDSLGDLRTFVEKVHQGRVANSG